MHAELFGSPSSVDVGAEIGLEVVGAKLDLGGLIE